MAYNISKETLHHYIDNNEVIYQVLDKMIEVSNNKEKKNKETLLTLLKQNSTVDVYEKDDSMVREDFYDLNNWSQSCDLLFFLVDLGVLICITKESAISNNLISA